MTKRTIKIDTNQGELVYVEVTQENGQGKVGVRFPLSGKLNGKAIATDEVQRLVKRFG